VEKNLNFVEKDVKSGICEVKIRVKIVKLADLRITDLLIRPRKHDSAFFNPLIRNPPIR